ncbi:MAG: (2Fe-2S)-binding protein [Armatimonadota bacterium]
MPQRTELRVNGERRVIDVDPERSLLSVLRDDLELTGAKYGCGEAQCGACTVVIDGQAARSCVTPVSAAAGKSITTIEGLAGGEALHPLQEAFIQEDALQCGYCTTGMIMSAYALLRRNPEATEAEIRKGLQGNICRCGIYSRVAKAVRAAAEAMPKEEKR